MSSAQDAVRAARDLPNRRGGVRFHEVYALREVECFIKEVLNLSRLSSEVRGKENGSCHTVSPMMY